VGYGWSPFTSGQWIFDPASGGYAWLSYQPWAMLLITMVDGSSMLPAADGFILRRSLWIPPDILSGQ